MRALTLHQPWASLVAVGAKRYETRSWGTGYRGMLAIHASLRRPSIEGLEVLWKAQEWARSYRLVCSEALDRLGTRYACARGLPLQLPLGVVVATCRLEACTLMGSAATQPPDELEELLGNWSPERYAWRLEAVVASLDPRPVRGKQGLWEWRPTL